MCPYRPKPELIFSFLHRTYLAATCIYTPTEVACFQSQITLCTIFSRFDWIKFHEVYYSFSFSNRRESFAGTMRNICHYLITTSTLFINEVMWAMSRGQYSFPSSMLKVIRFCWQAIKHLPVAGDDLTNYMLNDKLQNVQNEVLASWRIWHLTQ